MIIEEHILLAPLTTFKIGGPARFFTRVKTIDELKESLDFARDQHQKVLILGGGSNVLVDDAGFDGLVVKMEMRGAEFDGEQVVADAGESWDALVAQAVEKNLWGVENLSGIPGTAGAAPMQNIGAYGQEIADTLAWVEALDMKSGEIRIFEKSECGFGYRASRFKKDGRHVLLRVALELKKNGAPNLSYRDLAGRDLKTLPEIRRAVLDIRSKKFPDVAKEGTAGSFFLNPVVSAAKAAELAAKFPELPLFPGEKGVKISLAWLLDHALNLKRARAGGARVFENQPLVIVAAQNASSRDVAALAREIQEKVRKIFGIELEEEVRVLQ